MIQLIFVSDGWSQCFWQPRFPVRVFFFYHNFWKVFIVKCSQFCVEKIKWFLGVMNIVNFTPISFRNSLQVGLLIALIENPCYKIWIYSFHWEWPIDMEYEEVIRDVNYQQSIQRIINIIMIRENVINEGCRIWGDPGGTGISGRNSLLHTISVNSAVRSWVSESIRLTLQYPTNNVILSLYLIEKISHIIYSAFCK